VFRKPVVFLVLSVCSRLRDLDVDECFLVTAVHGSPSIGSDLMNSVVVARTPFT